MGAARKLATFAPQSSLSTCNFDQIDSPGTYVENRFGTIFRMPEDALPAARRRKRRNGIVCHELWTVTRLSDDPFIPMSKARRLATALGLIVSV